MKIKKFGQGYFLIDKMTNKKISAKFLEKIERYPYWDFSHQDLISP